MTAALLDAAVALRPMLRAAAADIERERRLPASVRNALAGIGAFHLQLDPRYGGPGADPLLYLDVIEELSRGDASSGWCAMVASESSACVNAWLTPDTVGEMLGEPARAVVALTAVGKGRAVVEGDGHRVSGRWRFVSGCRHSDWLGALAVVHDGDAPRLGAQGAPALRIVFLPRAQVTLIDTWQTRGLRGTASDDFEVEDLLVPQRHGFDLPSAPLDTAPAWRIPLGLRLAMSKAATVLGMARAALDALPPLLDRAPFAGARPARDEPRTQSGYAEAEAHIESGGAYLRQEVARVWARVLDGEGLDTAAVARARLAIVHAGRSALAAVELAQTLAGTGGVFDAQLDRAVRDLGVARHHVQLQAHVMEDIGRVMLGYKPQYPLF